MFINIGNHMSPSEWLTKRRDKLSGELINKIQYTIIVTPGKSDYETAYRAPLRKLLLICTLQEF